MPNPRPSTNRTGVQDPLLKYQMKPNGSTRGCLRQCLIIIATVVIVVLLLVFIVIFVAIPLIFKYSPDLQRGFVFPTARYTEADAELSNFTGYNITGVRNLYVPVNKAENVTLGVWHILPEALLNNFTHNDDYNYSAALADTEYPVLLYFHGNGAERDDCVHMYYVLRMTFHVIAFDYRSYGDSSLGELTEDTIVEDSVALYKWLRTQTDGQIYFWGHSLGSAISTHTAARLSDENITPTGLFLEAPFNSMRDEVKHVLKYLWFNKIFSWLPWYEATVVDPFEHNGFGFRTNEHILMVDCPIMIVHAEDDSVIPYTQSEKLFQFARENRNLTAQGNVTFHLFPAHREYDHFRLYRASELPKFIRTHIKECEAFRARMHIYN